MQTPIHRRGASVSARTITPSIDLASLVEFLCKALSSSDPPTLPFIRIENDQMVINTRTTLHTLVTSKEFKDAFAAGEQSGFMRDCDVPNKGTAARIGGRLLHGSEKALTNAVDKLQHLIAEHIESALATKDPEFLLSPSFSEGLQSLAESLHQNSPQRPATACMVPMVFASNDRTVNEKSKDLGRVLSALETVDGQDGLELMLKGIANYLRKNDLEDEIEDTLECIRAQRNRPGSLIREFIDFLDDEALSRVRLQVTMRLMDTVASQSHSRALQAYVKRVQACFSLFGSAQGAALQLDPSIVFGQAHCTDFSEHLRKALFYTCLPVWPQWSVQLFESRTEPSQGFATVREVSYRFRVNGINPSTGKSAFESRLQRLRDGLLGEDAQHNSRTKKDLAELLFLYLVIPNSITDPTDIDIQTKSQKFATALLTDPIGTIEAVLTSLTKRAQVVDALADELIEVLKNKSNKVVTLTNETVDKFRISLHRDIINWKVIDSITPDTDILQKSASGDNAIAWFEHLTVSTEGVIPGSLASYSVKTELKERSLVIAGESATIAMHHDLSAPLLTVHFDPVLWCKNSQTIKPCFDENRPFDSGRGIKLQYDVSLLQLRKTSQSSDQEQVAREHFRAASITAFTLLSYLTIFTLQRFVRQKLPDTSIALLRLQQSGAIKDRESDARDGVTSLYASSQAIEKALAREGPIKLQGLTKDNKNWDYKSRGAIHALLGGQPLVFQFDGALDKVALVTYVTRPCDSHPAYKDDDGFILLSRTYVAERTSDGKGKLKILHMRSRLVESSKDFKNPQPILEEIARLDKMGFKHIMLLSQHFGNRHIGRAAERHAPHGTREFLEEATQRFPDLFIYTLRRDVFPATRLRKRQKNESGFEVLSFKDHQEMYRSIGSEILRSVMPIYTFATLTVVGDDENRPQSGFCTYYFDSEQRITDVERSEKVRQNILGIGNEPSMARLSLVSVLRAIHFMESEKAHFSSNPYLQPVLDPYGWVSPVKRSAAGEIEVISRRRKGSVFLSLSGVLAQVTKILHKGDT